MPTRPRLRPLLEPAAILGRFRKTTRSRPCASASWEQRRRSARGVHQRSSISHSSRTASTATPGDRFGPPLGIGAHRQRARPTWDPRNSEMSRIVSDHQAPRTGRGSLGARERASPDRSPPPAGRRRGRRPSAPGARLGEAPAPLLGGGAAQLPLLAGLGAELDRAQPSHEAGAGSHRDGASAPAAAARRRRWRAHDDLAAPPAAGREPGLDPQPADRPLGPRGVGEQALHQQPQGPLELRPDAASGRPGTRHSQWGKRGRSGRSSPRARRRARNPGSPKRRRSRRRAAGELAEGAAPPAGAGSRCSRVQNARHSASRQGVSPGDKRS